MPENWTLIAKKLSAKHDGLPHANWLVKHGYWGLYQAMRRNPQQFKDFKRTNHLKKTCRQKGYNKQTAAKWISLAEQIAYDHNGTLPSDAEIMRLGHNALNAYIRRYPSLFTHLPRTPDPSEHWLLVANKLVKRYKHIPSTTWLLNHGYKAFYNFMIRNKSTFAKFPRQYKHLRPIV